ncbi:uncharacterized protein PRCAT00001265001 [Priceomyces carsonii]|uniref:uncharacterized protein n=1 Tax=Priceomyces carsonii TaxID=28549 RepID=UPI002EDABE2F|nr:unnamed protein product [Priceomyces carsonii]
MLVEEIPKGPNSNGSTVYFTSLINISARPRHLRDAQGDEEPLSTSNINRGSKNRPKVNYNVNKLMYAQTQAGIQIADGPTKSVQQLQIERLVLKRVNELNKESTASSFELPKGFSYHAYGGSSNKKKSRQGNTPTTKRIISSRRNLNLYFEEEKNIMWINSILSLNYQFVESKSFNDNVSKRRRINDKPPRARLRLCCICGENSNYSRCQNCGLFSCSVKCNLLHEELRCN